MARDWEDRGRYGQGGDDYQRGRGRWRGERGRDWSDRISDEVRSWYGDHNDRRHMEEDERYGGRHYRGGYPAGPRGYYEDDDYGGYGGYADRGPNMVSATAGYDMPRRQRGYGAGYERQYRGDFAPRGGQDYGDRGSGYRGRGGSHERGFMERAGDEIASWFGDEEAERRREMDAGHRGRGPKNYTRSDERIREDVNDRLSDDPHIDASDIEVSVSSCEVTLDGTVTERFAKRHAEDIAEMVSGVKHVQNNLRVSTPQRGIAGTMESDTGRRSSATSGAGGDTTPGTGRTPGSSGGFPSA